MVYDPNSGLVYTETILSTRTIACTSNHWTQCRGSRPKYNPSPGTTQSLVEIAIRTLLCNLESLDEDSLSTVPLSILEKLWQAIRASDLDSLRVWQLFARTGLGNRAFQHRFASACPRHRLLDLLDRRAGSPPSCWLTNLTICGAAVASPEVTEVSRLSSLRNLHIYYGGSRARAERRPVLNDGVIRTWATMAAEERGVLGSLETIFIQGHPEVTRWSLCHLHAFPALDTFCLQDCGVERRDAETFNEAAALGWPAKEHGRFQEYAQTALNRSGESSWSNLVHGYFKHRRDLVSTITEDRPTLDAVIGASMSNSTVRRLDRVTCFERDGTHPLPTRTERPSGGAAGSSLEPTAKKRKLKHGRSVGLHEMLAGM